MRFAAAALGCFIATLALAGADDSRPRLDALLARVRDAAGRPYRLHLRSTGSEETGDESVRIETESEGARFRIRRCSGRICSGEYVDGNAVLLTNLNDSALPAAPEDPRRITLRAIENEAFAEPDFERDGGQLASRIALALRDGSIMQRIAVTAPHGATLDALIDPQTGLLEGVRGAGLAVTFADQRRVGPLTLPFEITTNARHERFTERTIDDAPLEPPRGLVPRIAGERSSAPFVELDRPSVDPVVECALGKERVPCLFDSGNSGLSISLELAERLGLEPVAESLKVRGLGAYQTGVVRAPELHVGTAVYPPAYYAVLHDVHPYGYDLILGADAFARARVTIDYPARTVRLEPESSEPLAGGIELAFENFLPVVDCRLDSTGARLAIDTGDESTVNLASDFFAAHPSLFTPETRARVAGIGGSGEELLGTIDSVRVGGYALIRQSIGVTNAIVPTAQGHLGSGALTHFSVTFDYAHRRVGLSPRRGDAAVVSSSSDSP